MLNVVRKQFKSNKTKDDKKSSIVWNGMLFENEKVFITYKQLLLSLGRCPVCNDFLFLDFDKLDGYYTAKVHCVSHKCSYEKDFSNEFNSRLGVKKKVDLGKYSWKFKNPPSHYWNLSNSKRSRNLCNTGTLKSSINCKVVDELPSNPRNDTLYWKYNEYGVCNVYVYTPTDKGYCKVFAYDEVLSYDFFERDAFGRKKRRVFKE